MKLVKIAILALFIMLLSGAIALSEGFFMRSGEILFAESCPEGYQPITDELILGEGEVRTILNDAKYFASDDLKLLSVDETGVVRALSAGKTTLSVYLEENVRKDLPVEIRIAPKSIKLNESKGTLDLGETFQLKATLTSASAATVTWDSSAPDVVSVDENGLITAVGEGTCTVTARTHNGLSAECAVTSKLPPPAEIDLFSDSITVSVGESEAILYTLEGGYQETVRWTSNDKSIAIVDDTGLVSAIREGKTVVCMEASGGDVRFVDVFVNAGATSIDFPAHEVTMYKGGHTTVEPYIDGASDTFKYVSMDTSIADTDPETGEIRAHKAGSVYILGVTPNYVFDEFLLTIVEGPEELILTVERDEISIGETIHTSHNLDGFEPIYTWYESSDPEVVNVNEYGVVTGLKKGAATISIHSGGLTDEREIRVLPPAEEISAWSEREQLGAGEFTQSHYAFKEGTGVVRYETSDMRVAQIDEETGTIYALSPGTCEITLSVSEDVSASFPIEVLPAPESVYIEKAAYTLSAGNRHKFVFGANEGALTTFSVTSSNPDLVWYEEGFLVCADRTGTAEVTVSTHNGYKATAEITVIPAPERITVSANPLEHNPDFDYYLLLSPGKTHALNAFVDSVDDIEIAFSASHPNIASVTEEGHVTSHKEGTCLVTLTLYSGDKTRVLVAVE